MLKVIVDATPITAQPSGVGFHVSQLIKYLAREQKQTRIELSIFYQPTFQKWLRRDFSLPDLIDTEQLQNKVIFPYPVRFSNWISSNTPQLYPWLLDRKLQSYDLFHGTNFGVYPDRQTNKIMNLYDLAFLCWPQYVDSVVAKYEQRVRQCLPWTKAIIVSSQSTKQDVVEYLAISPEKIWVTPLASRYSKNYLAGLDLEALQQQQAYDFQQPYIFFLSTIEPRKNILTLIKAFNYLKQKHRIDHNLVLVGGKGWQYQPIFAEIARSPYQAQIYHLNYLSDRVVALFYKLASVFVYPSYYEGFGLPILEAMTLGAPVVCSNTSALPEVAGDAALLFDPQQPLELAEAILKIIESPRLRDRLIEQGYQQAAKFSWASTAQKTIEAYRAIGKS